MNSTVIQIGLRFIFLVLLQVLIFNNINFLGHINPYPYIAFVFLYPLQKNRASFLLISFLFGLSIDFFLNSGGINAAATLFIAYVRLGFLKFLLGTSEFDYKLFHLRSLPFGKSIVYMSILTIAHHFILFGLEYFNWGDFQTILLKTVLSSIFTIILLLLGIFLFTKQR